MISSAEPVIHPNQPFPQFYITRTDQSVVPLIALDELPSWIQVGNWNWSEASLFYSMAPASLYPIPRVGEYDVICHYCCSSLEIVQKSVSQNSDTSTIHLHAVDLHRPSKSECDFLLAQSPGYNPHVLHSEPQFIPGSSSLYAGICLAGCQGQGRAPGSPLPPPQCWKTSPASCENAFCQPKVSEALLFNPSNHPQEFEANIISSDFYSTRYFSNPNAFARKGGRGASIETIATDSCPPSAVVDSQSAKLSDQIDEITTAMSKLSLVDVDSDILSTSPSLDVAKRKMPNNVKGKSCANQSLDYLTNRSPALKWKKPTRKYWQRSVSALSERRNIFSRFKRRSSTRLEEKYKLLYNITGDKIESGSSISAHWEVISRPAWDR